MAKKIVITKEISLHDYDSFADLVEELQLDDEGITILSESGDDDFPCYFDRLTCAHNVPKKLIPAVLESALHYGTAGAETILMVNVTSEEDNHGEWLEQARNYPGATITSIKRGNGSRTCYTLLFPATPAEELDEKAGRTR